MSCSRVAKLVPVRHTRLTIGGLLDSIVNASPNWFIECQVYFTELSFLTRVGLLCFTITFFKLLCTYVCNILEPLFK